MTIYEVKAPDGAIIQIRGPENAPPEVLQRIAAEQYAKVESPITDGINTLGRKLGLTARAAIEGLPAIADVAWNPIRLGMRDLGGPTLPSMEKSGAAWADMVGLPSPETKDERVVQEGAKLMAGAGGMVKLARKGAEMTGGLAQRVLSGMAEAPATQAAAAATAGTTGQAAKEGGASPWGQFGASLAAGLAGGLSASAAERAARNVYASLSSLVGRVTPNVDVVLERTLAASGIDWAALSAQTKAALRSDAQKMILNGQRLDRDALGRLADFRQVEGTTPLLGDVTADPRLVSLQRNLAKQQANMPTTFGAPDLAGATNRNAKAVINALDNVAPSAADRVQTGQGLIATARGQDEAMRAAENALYAQAREAAGRDIPLARGAFIEDAFSSLARENKVAALPESIGKMLNDISRGQVNVEGRVYQTPFNVDTIDTLKTALAAASRSADGNGRAAIKIVRDALERVQLEPIKAGLGGATTTSAQAEALRAADALPRQALDAWDTARRTARQRRDWQESAPWIEDALDGADPIGFVRKHVVNGSLENLRSMRATIGGNEELLGAVRKQIIDYIRERGSVDASHATFTSKGMSDALRALTDQRLAVFFTPAEVQQIRAAINVGRHIQAQPIASAVNNSNSGAYIAAKVANMLAAGTGLPVLGPMAAAPMRDAVTRLQIRQMGNVQRGLLSPEQIDAGNPLIPSLLGSSLLLSQ